MKQKLYLFTLVLFSQMLSYGQNFSSGGINYLVTSATSPYTVAVGTHSDADGLVNVNIPETVEYSGTTYAVTSFLDYAFYNCSTITSVSMGNSVILFRESAFAGCTNLSSVTLSESLTALGEGTFRNCVALTSIIIPDLVTEIESNSFNNCTALSAVTITSSLTNIGSYAFSNCTSLASINIPISLTGIGGYAFQNCSSLTTINIPSSVTIINGDAFKNCSGLTAVTVNWTNPVQIFPDVFSGLTISNITLNIPNGTAATYQAAPVWQNFNINNPASHLNFDGVNDYVTLPNESNFDFTNQMTVEFWMNSSATPQQWDGLVTKGDNSWRIALTSSGTVAFTGTGAFTDFYSNTAVTDGTWHHVAVTYNGANAIIYIDGVQENSQLATGNIDNSNLAVAIGENLQQIGRFYSGNMDEVRIWNVARTTSQISGSKNCELQGNESGLVAYYKFNQGNSGANNSGVTSLLDSSASTNNGDFSGFALNGTSSNFLQGSVVATGSTMPTAPAAAAQTFVNSAMVSDLVPAPSASILWYSVATGGSALATDVALATGTYYASSVNANGCESERTAVSVTAAALFVSSISKTNILCHGAATGSATVVVSGGAAPYFYSWSPLGGNEATASNLVAGLYTVTIMDANDNEVMESFIITQPAPFSGMVLSQSNVSCFGETDGGATIVVSGGTAPYNYQWSNGQSTPTLSGAGSGVYNLYVTDSNGCGIIPGIGVGTTVATVTITQPVQLTVPTAAANQTLCSGLSVADLEPYANATIKWFAEANATTPLNNSTLLVSGTTYYVASTNANGCQSNKVASQVTLTAAPPTPTIAGVTTQDFADITITATSPCEEAGGLYLYKGTSNGKNKYESAFYSPAKLAYDATTSKWQLYVNAIDNVIFENSTTNSDLFPPATGWVGQSFCNGSILTIDTITYSQKACEGSNASVLNPAPSSSINWYSNGGWPVFTNDALAAGLYYVAFVNSDGCESPRTPVSFSYNPKSMPPLVAGGMSDSSIIVTITGACEDSSGNYVFDGNIVNGKHSYFNQTESVIEFNGINWQLKNQAGDILFENINIPGFAPPATGWIPSCSGVMNMAFIITEQTLCPGATAADIVATGTNLVYFNGSSQQIPSTTVLADTQYYVASIGENGCLSDKIYVSISLEVPAVVYPTSVAFDSGLNIVTSGDCPFSIPSGPFQFVALDANGKSTYIDDGSGNSFIAFDDAIQKWKFYHNNGTIYFYNDDTTGLIAPATGWYPVDCADSSLDLITYTKFAQSFCGNATVADLTATGTNYNWYYNPSGGTPLDSSQPLFNNQQYYVSAAGVGGCESPRRRLEVKVVNAPTANAQTFCGNTTVANLVATGQNLKWYADNVTTDFLQNSTTVSTGTYYVSQTVGSCETPRTAVTVTVSPLSTIGSVTTSICAGQTYTWPANGQTYTTAQSGVTVVNGCNTATLNLTISVGITWFADADNDTYGNPVVTQSSCDQPVGYVSNNLDCNDAVFAINPGATEICWNNIDDNCNNTKSEGCVAIPVYVNNPVTITNFSTHLSAVPYTYPGAASLDYRYEVTNISVTPNQTVTFTQTGLLARYFTIPTSIRGFDTDYAIRASAVINGEEVPYAVPVIIVRSSGIPAVKLAPTSCGAELSRLDATISASPGFNATLYKFRIRLTSDNGTMPTYYYFESASRFISANSFVGLSLQYNTSYSVSVQYTTASVGAAATAITAEYGEECTITTARIPLIGLNAPQCGSTLNRLGATISATPATYALQYQFRVRLTSDNGPTPTYYMTVPSASRFSSLTAAQGLVVANGTQYSVSVRYSIPVVGGGSEFSDYDDSECIVQTPIAAVPRTLAASFSVVAYPNPFSEGFHLDVKTENAGIVSIKTYDMIGRLIEERSSKVNTLESLTIGANYPSGVYNVIVSQEDEIRTVRVVKR